MNPHLLDDLVTTPRPTPWLDDFSGVSRREALQQLLDKAERDERRPGAPSTWTRLSDVLRGAWRRLC